MTLCVAVNTIFLSDQLAFPECGLCMNVLNVSLSWPFQHIFIVCRSLCRSQCESKPSPNILMFLFFSQSLLSCQILYKICHFTVLAQWRLVSLGILCSTCINLLSTVYVPKVPKCVIFNKGCVNRETIGCGFEFGNSWSQESHSHVQPVTLYCQGCHTSGNFVHFITSNHRQIWPLS